MNHRESGVSPRGREWVERLRASGLSVSEFCARFGVAASSLYAWKKRMPAALAFVEAKVTEAMVRPGRVEVRLRAGRRVVVRRGDFDRRLLLEVVAALESLPQAEASS